MSTYLVVDTKSYKAYPVANNPCMNVVGSYVPVTTCTESTYIQTRAEERSSTYSTYDPEFLGYSGTITVGQGDPQPAVLTVSRYAYSYLQQYTGGALDTVSEYMSIGLDGKGSATATYYDGNAQYSWSVTTTGSGGRIYHGYNRTWYKDTDRSILNVTMSQEDNTALYTSYSSTTSTYHTSVTSTRTSWFDTRTLRTYQTSIGETLTGYRYSGLDTVTTFSSTSMWPSVTDTVYSGLSYTVTDNYYETISETKTIEDVVRAIASNSTTSYALTSYPEEMYGISYYSSTFTSWSGMTHGTGTESLYVSVVHHSQTLSQNDGAYQTEYSPSLHIDREDPVSFTVSYINSANSLISQSTTESLISSSAASLYTDPSNAHRSSYNVSCYSDHNSYSYSEFVRDIVTTYTTTSNIWTYSVSYTRSTLSKEYLFTAYEGASTYSSSTSNETCSVSGTYTSESTSATLTVPGTMTSIESVAYSGTYTKTTGTYTASAQFVGSRYHSVTSGEYYSSTVIAPGQYSIKSTSSSGVTYYNNLGSYFSGVSLYDATRTLQYSPKHSIEVSTYFNAYPDYPISQTISHQSLSGELPMITMRTISRKTSNYSTSSHHGVMLSESNYTTNVGSSTYYFDASYPVTSTGTKQFTSTAYDSGGVCTNPFSTTRAILYGDYTASSTEPDYKVSYYATFQGGSGEVVSEYSHSQFTSYYRSTRNGVRNSTTRGMTLTSTWESPIYQGEWTCSVDHSGNLTTSSWRVGSTTSGLLTFSSNKVSTTPEYITIDMCGSRIEIGTITSTSSSTYYTGADSRTRTRSSVTTMSMDIKAYTGFETYTSYSSTSNSLYSVKTTITSTAETTYQSSMSTPL